MVGRWRKKRRKGSVLETAGGLICWLMSWQARITEGLDSCQTRVKRALSSWVYPGIVREKVMTVSSRS